ncbi:uncharacterized protein LOC112588376 [Harpegnathos saltator]|uniref:uncharacterized protein LOC112588376 n=1 Tax=Harpegnathos saltator TaxID=610380 RepID=UPI000DBED6B0|nr:uncharacterized protein LOC112588376 [Harpegnathos saltator]
MQLKVTLKKVIAIVKLSLFLIWFWPLPKNASTGKMLCMKLYQLISMIFIVTGMASMLYAVVNNLYDLNLFVKSVLGVFPCIHIIWNILCHVIIYRRLQVTNMDIVS